jgi:large subunit ribosomal protein L33
MRDIINLSCTTCKQKNYTTTKNKRKTPDKLELKKYCRFCQTHTVHKETNELAKHTGVNPQASSSNG